MASRPQGTPVSQSAFARLGAGIKWLFTGDGDFFGPGTPMAPAAQQAVEGRGWDYQTGYNLQQQPRAGEAITFPQLRGLADGHDLLRLAIETRKDQMAKLNFVVRPKDGSKPDDRCKTIQDFLQTPDKEHDWDDWLRMWLEEVFVTDAAAIYPRKTRGGELYALEHIDGATIKRILSADGRTPVPPDPAYAQVIKGITAANYTRDELFYLPRNVRVSRIYGYSPVEQIIMTVNIALRRQVHQLNYYTEGNIPPMLVGVPATWNVDQIEKFQKVWDAMMDGDLAKRQKLRFVPGELKTQLLQTEKIFDETDEWLARVICYAMNLPPNAFVKQQNRATAGSAQEIAQEEGLAPIMRYVARKLTALIGSDSGFKSPDLELGWEDIADIDPLVQTQIDDINVKNGTKTVDEIRDDRGDEPLTPEQKAEILAAKPVPPGSQPPGEEDGKPGAKPTSTKGDEDGVTAAAAEKFEAIVVGAIAKVEAAVAGVHARVDAIELPPPVEKADARIADFAQLVEHGVPANKAAKTVGLSIDDIEGGDVPMVKASLIPFSIASDPAPLTKSEPIAPAPQPAPQINVTSPDVKVDAHIHLPPAPEAKKAGPKRITMTKPNGDVVSAEITEE